MQSMDYILALLQLFGNIIMVKPLYPKPDKDRIILVSLKVTESLYNGVAVFIIFIIIIIDLTLYFF